LANKFLGCILEKVAAYDVSQYAADNVQLTSTLSAILPTNATDFLQQGMLCEKKPFKEFRTRYGSS
jgi:hypothetical protein